MCFFALHIVWCFFTIEKLKNYFYVLQEWYDMNKEYPQFVLYSNTMEVKFVAI
jgi:hypothetical protein